MASQTTAELHRTLNHRFLVNMVTKHFKEFGNLVPADHELIANKKPVDFFTISGKTFMGTIIDKFIVLGPEYLYVTDYPVSSVPAGSIPTKMDNDNSFCSQDMNRQFWCFKKQNDPKTDYQTDMMAIEDHNGYYSFKHHRADKFKLFTGYIKVNGLEGVDMGSIAYKVQFFYQHESGMYSTTDTINGKEFASFYRTVDECKKIIMENGGQGQVQRYDLCFRPHRKLQTADDKLSAYDDIKPIYEITDGIMCVSKSLPVMQPLTQMTISEIGSTWIEMNPDKANEIPDFTENDELTLS